MDLDLFAPPERETVLTVTELTRSIRSLLEGKFTQVTVIGEISNYRSPGSGHLYFTIKDESAVLSAVMFRGDASRISFPLKEGLQVKAKGRITVYEARGQYQIQVQSLQAAGQGTLQQQFEALKQKLIGEGLFETDRKKSLPVFPETVGIITSLQGAVIQDFLRILQRRAPGIRIQVRGVRVQGDGAAEEMIQALHAFEKVQQVDVVVFARGGGSLEDLWEFNNESLARAIANSPLPTISAVGHETDFTIADFVADLRAPTPSAAAELISRDWSEWRDLISQFGARLQRGARHSLDVHAERLKRLSQSALFREPIRVVRAYQQKVDDLQESIRLGLTHALTHKKHRLEKSLLQWTALNPRHSIQQKRECVQSIESRLRALGPDQTLKRGFAWVTDEKGTLIREASASLIGKTIQVRLDQGQIKTRVEAVVPKK
jgi:exodeoxyribonuclease VII large subunit